MYSCAIRGKENIEWVEVSEEETIDLDELEHLIGKYQEKLDSLSEDKTMIIRERVEWEGYYTITNGNVVNDAYIYRSRLTSLK